MNPSLSRRSFLARSALAGGSVLLSRRTEAALADSELRIAVVGLRNRGAQLVRETLAAKGARLVAVCDVDPTILRQHGAELAKIGHKVATYGDYRKLCEAGDIDGIVIATPNHTHALIAVTAAAAGKHVYVEKPVSHNIRDGRLLAEAQERFGVIIQHGFQRRSETAWRDAFDWISEGHLGKLKLARGFCYKPRPSIGRVKGAQLAPEGLDYDLWCGPRPRLPIMRRQFHYDWHWQFAWGNGDIGNQGAHQLDVCRWALGDPDSMPRSVRACGNRFGYDDDGEWPNTQLVSIEYETAPVLFEVRGLPSRNLDFDSGMDRYSGLSVGNVIEYEGGRLIGGHGPECTVVDGKGKELKSFSGTKSSVLTWIESIIAGKQEPMQSAGNGHLSTSLAHLANISWQLGLKAPEAGTIDSEPMEEAFARLGTHLDANGIDPVASPVRIGPRILPSASGDTFLGDLKEIADPFLGGPGRDGFRLPS